ALKLPFYRELPNHVPMPLMVPLGQRDDDSVNCELSDAPQPPRAAAALYGGLHQPQSMINRGREGRGPSKRKACVFAGSSAGPAIGAWSFGESLMRAKGFFSSSLIVTTTGLIVCSAARSASTRARSTAESRLSAAISCSSSP